MSKERGYEAPSNIVGLNKYMRDTRRRVPTDSIQEQGWYIARLVNPEPENIDQYAADVLMRVVKMEELERGRLKVYLTSVTNDGAEDLDEDDAAVVSRDGFFVENEFENGYLLDMFSKGPRDLGVLAAEVALTV